MRPTQINICHCSQEEQSAIQTEKNTTYAADAGLWNQAKQMLNRHTRIEIVNYMEQLQPLEQEAFKNRLNKIKGHI